MLKSLLFYLFLIVGSTLGAAPAATRIDIEADIFELPKNHIIALREALDLSIWDCLPDDLQHTDPELYQSIQGRITETPQIFKHALASQELKKALGIPSKSGTKVFQLINRWMKDMINAPQQLSKNPEYQALFLESHYARKGTLHPQHEELSAQRDSRGVMDDQAAFSLNPDTDSNIERFFKKSQKIINSVAILLLGEQPKEGIFKHKNYCIAYIKNSSLLIQPLNFAQNRKLRPFELFEKPGSAPCIRKSTYILDQDSEGNALLNRKGNYLTYTKPKTNSPGIAFIEYAYVLGDHSSKPHQKHTILEGDGKLFDLAAHLFDPLATGGLVKEAIVPLPSTRMEKLLLEIHFLENLLEAKKAQSPSTALITHELAEEVQVIESTLEEKQAELQQAFVEENPAFLETAKKVSEDRYEDEWKERQKHVLDDNVGATKNQQKKIVKRARDQWNASKARVVQEKQNEFFRKKLDILKKEAQGKFKPFYQGVKSFFQSKGIDVTLTQTGNSGSHTGKIEFTAQGASAGSIIVPNKKITKGLLGAICEEISALSERLAT